MGGGGAQGKRALGIVVRAVQPEIRLISGSCAVPARRGPQWGPTRPETGPKGRWKVCRRVLRGLRRAQCAFGHRARRTWSEVHRTRTVRGRFGSFGPVTGGYPPPLVSRAWRPVHARFWAQTLGLRRLPLG